MLGVASGLLAGRNVEGSTAATAIVRGTKGAVFFMFIWVLVWWSVWLVDGLHVLYVLLLRSHFSCVCVSVLESAMKGMQGD